MRRSGVRIPSAPPNPLVRGHARILDSGAGSGNSAETQHKVGAWADLFGPSGPVWGGFGATGPPVWHGDHHTAPERPSLVLGARARSRRHSVAARLAARGQRPDPLRPAQPGPRPSRLPDRA